MTARKLNLPDTASVANKGSDGRLHAPSATRNISAILSVLQRFAPNSGSALEIASGTGQQILQFATELPNLSWQPTDIDEDRIQSIQNWTAYSGSENVLAPAFLNASKPGWSSTFGSRDLIILVNLLHLISHNDALTVIQEASAALNPNGVFLVYGPFMRGNRFASEGDEEFHNSLFGQDKSIGYKSFEEVLEWKGNSGLLAEEPIQMPANNLMLVSRKPPEM